MLTDNARSVRIKRYVIVHAGLVLAVAALMLYYLIIESLSGKAIYCPIHDLLHIYCPFCGSTRAVICLLKLDFVGAFFSNPAFLVLCILALVLDIRAAVLIFLNKEGKMLPAWLGKYVIFTFSLWWVICNFLLLVLKIDLLGDFIH